MLLFLVASELCIASVSTLSDAVGVKPKPVCRQAKNALYSSKSMFLQCIHRVVFHENSFCLWSYGSYFFSWFDRSDGVLATRIWKINDDLYLKIAALSLSVRIHTHFAATDNTTFLATCPTGMPTDIHVVQLLACDSLATGHCCEKGKVLNNLQKSVH
jgi:hypothetical protein